jgi:hypothetical protein
MIQEAGDILSVPVIILAPVEQSGGLSAPLLQTLLVHPPLRHVIQKLLDAFHAVVPIHFAPASLESNEFPL